jgi:SAM-dependent methyltransferase
MSIYYTGKHAQHYNARWHTYTVRTLEETKAIIDIATLRLVPERQGRGPRVLDVACGTGILLEPRFFWAAFEWLLRSIERTNVRAYNLAEAQALCQQAGLHVASEHVFTVDWLWHGWVVRAYRTASETGPART